MLYFDFRILYQVKTCVTKLYYGLKWSFTWDQSI